MRLIACSNIEKLVLGNFIMSHIEEMIPDLVFDKLKTLEIVFNSREIESANKLIDKFITVRHLKLNFVDDFVNFEERALNLFFESISKLKHLIHLKICFNSGRDQQLFAHLMKQMTNLCRNVRAVECIPRLYWSQTFNLREIFSPLMAFNGLKRLYATIFLKLTAVNPKMMANKLNELFSFESFKDFSNITHLSLRFFPSLLFSESVLKDIDIHLPKLQYLQIHNEFETTPEGVAKVADILSRLSRLETIKLRFTDEIVCQQIKEQIAQKCKKIRTVDIEYTKKMSVIGSRK